MRLIRVVLPALCLATLAFGCEPALAEFGVKESAFEAGTCTVRSCEYSSPTSDFYTQAAGHPQWGITAFELNHTG
ncbi:MAG: hypothetical protein ACRDK2_00190, partial [Solirubrobacteraceae bacterium]